MPPESSDNVIIKTKIIFLKIDYKISAVGQRSPSGAFAMGFAVYRGATDREKFQA